MGKEVAKRRSEELLSILEGVAIDDARVCKDAARALDLAPGTLLEMRQWDDSQLLAAGWTRRAFEAAWEARKPRSEASYAVQLAHERTGMRIRQSVERGAGAPQVAVVITGAPAPLPDAEAKRRAPVIDVNAEEK